MNRFHSVKNIVSGAVGVWGKPGVKKKITIIMIITTTYDRVCSMIREGRFAIPVFVRDKQENVYRLVCRTKHTSP